MSTRATLRPHELCTPATFAVEADFARVLPALVGLCGRFRAELDQWRERLGLSPTACAILAFAHLFRGIRGAGAKGGGDGLGIQAPIRWWAELLGRHPSTVADAFLELEGHRDTRWVRPAKGEGSGERVAKRARFDASARIFGRRRSPTRKVAAVTGRRLEAIEGRDGSTRRTINVHGVFYVTTRGARTLADVGLTRRFVRGQSGRKTTRTGLVGFLLTTLDVVLRAVARRCASVPINPIPDEDQRPSRVDIDGSRGAGVVENTGPPGGGRGVRFAGHVQSGESRPNGVSRFEGRALERYRRLQHVRLYPAVWERLDDDERDALTAELARLAPLVRAEILASAGEER